MPDVNSVPGMMWRLTNCCAESLSLIIVLSSSCVKCENAKSVGARTVYVLMPENIEKVLNKLCQRKIASAKKYLCFVKYQPCWMQIQLSRNS